jgi:DNA-nicking Smr family endonuclease
MTKDGKAMIDLHGLHPLEAIDKLDEAMLGLKRKKYLGKVIVITGTGHHSRGQSKVLPAIRDHLQRSGTRYKDATLEDNRGGVLILEIK